LRHAFELIIRHLSKDLRGNGKYYIINLVKLMREEIMKALLLILGLTFSIITFAEEPTGSSGVGETDGCTSAEAMENCECIVDGEGSEHNGTSAVVTDPVTGQTLEQ
jgi:hypothetical protein